MKSQYPRNSEEVVTLVEDLTQILKKKVRLVGQSWEEPRVVQGNSHHVREQSLEVIRRPGSGVVGATSRTPLSASFPYYQNDSICSLTCRQCLSKCGCAVCVGTF